MITQQELKDNLFYDNKTGLFIRLKSGNNATKVGDIAGSKHHSGYIYIYVHKKIYASHRLAWLYVHGNFPNNCIDHINNNRADNRIENLREATHLQNNRNTILRKDNKTGYKGVSYNNIKNKYVAQIKLNNKKIHLGYFNCANDAFTVYDKKAKELFGNFYNKGNNNG